MIRFLHSPHSFVLPKNVRFPEIKFKGSAEASKNGIIPFSHLYMTSASQLSHMVKYGGKGNLIMMPERISQIVFANNRCPIDLSFCERGIETKISDSGLNHKTQLKLAVVNGMGRGFGDNIVGLGVLQHLRNFLDLHFAQVEIDVLQRNREIQSQIYSGYSIIDNAVQLPVSVTKFFTYDAYFDLSDILAHPLFDQLPLYDFFIHALSLQKLICSAAEKRTKLKKDLASAKRLRKIIDKRAGKTDSDRPIVLIHPSASTPLRSIPSELMPPLVEGMLKELDVILICCIPNACADSRVIDLSDHSENINQFIDVISAVDAVITVGTVVYHVSGSLNIPTLLIPTVRADVESAQYLPSVQCFLPAALKKNISSKHMSRDMTDIANIRPIWEALNVNVLTDFLKTACKFKKSLDS